MIPTILKKILQSKAKHPILQDKRATPLTPPTLSFPFLIAEIKRASPSAGDIGAIESPKSLAKNYLEGGANAISVLCEKDFFKGDLEDLKQVKTNHPNATILRKDFITKLEQIAESYDFGADMVLLIAAVFIGENNENGGFERLKSLYEESLNLGLTPLLEVHNTEEVDFITPLKAALIGINSRNLHTFTIDKIKAYNLLSYIQKTNPQSKIIFESSINCSFDGFVVGNIGFDGILCGSYLVRDSTPIETLKSLKNAILCGEKSPSAFYQNAFKLLDSKKGFLKVCGITSKEDALMCAKALESRLDSSFDSKLDSNPDSSPRFNSASNLEKIAALGFILAPDSPRFVSPQKLQEIATALQAHPKILKIAVVKDDEEMLKAAIHLYKCGIIDALQLHGVRGKIFGGVDLENADFAFYEAWNVEEEQDLGEFISPFVLLDSKSALGGGSGKSIAPKTLESLKEKTGNYLCIAGGVGVSNLCALRKIGAKMLDVNSSLESSVGKKDPKKLAEFLEAFIGTK